MSSRIGDILVEAGKLQASELERALRVQADSKERLGNLLVQLGFIAERDLATTLAQMLDIPMAGSAHYKTPLDLDGRINPEFLTRHQAVPLAETEQHLVVAMTDPSDPFVLDAMELAAGKPVLPMVGVSADILAALETQHQRADALDELDDAIVTNLDVNIDDIEHLRDMASEAPVIRAVNQMIVRALEQRASDIHIEPIDGGLKVRYRIDGVLRDAEMPQTGSAAAVVSRIKVMADLNIAERRLPQDGRIKLRVEGREIDMRISTVPTLHGESVVLRLLDQGGVPLDFEALGFDGNTLTRLEALLARPQGIVLVTGPTGSGKTTSLYAALEQLNTPEKKILTVEDPVEYQLEGINQIQVMPKIDLTFANALRSILRQDPDIIMIGEMRDTETARIAVQAALTGHKVFSTLHTNDAPSSITRMLDMHIDDFLLTSTVDGVLAQRLVRKLCEHCAQPYSPSQALIDEHHLDQVQIDGEQPVLYHPVGCEHCEHSGYWGRTTIAELLVMTEAIRKVIIERGDADSIRRVAINEGMATMHEDGLRKALLGHTTLEEVERVTQSAAEVA